VTLNDVIGQEFDMIVLPGGEPGATNLGKDERVTVLLQQMAQAGKYTAAICAAPRVLAQGGLLEGRRATSYPGVLEPDSVAGLHFVNAPVVVDGRVITSRGPGTAMDFALQLIEVLEGKQKREQVETGLQRVTP
jgi:4-methyl-5(b-hydroxyethyl)-thiazole monophosphate biosynthesis